MDKVSFMIVRANQVELCGATVNAGSESRLCIREGCAVVHKVEVRRSDRELSPNHMYLLAPVSNNKLVVIPYPRLNLEGLDESAKGYLPGKVPVECEDGINILNLLDLELTVGRLWDVLYLEKLWYKYFEGHMAARSFLLNHCSNNLYCSFQCSRFCFVVLFLLLVECTLCGVFLISLAPLVAFHRSAHQCAPNVATPLSCSLRLLTSQRDGSQRFTAGTISRFKILRTDI